MNLRVIVGFLIAPVLVGLLLWIALAIESGTDWATALVVTIALPYSYLSALLVGVPVFLLMRRRGLFRWWHYVLGGLLIGLVPAIVMLSLVREFRDLDDVATIAGVGCFLGAITAWVFWVLVFWLGRQRAGV
jgi:hypothetical protein